MEQSNYVHVDWSTFVPIADLPQADTRASRFALLLHEQAERQGNDTQTDELAGLPYYELSDKIKPRPPCGCEDEE